MIFSGINFTPGHSTHYDMLNLKKTYKINIELKLKDSSLRQQKQARQHNTYV